MYKELIENLKPELNKTIDYLKGEFLKVKTSRATPIMIENIEINCYDQKMPLKELASIDIPQPRSIIVRPWDHSILREIEKGIRSSTSFSPMIDSDIIRINIPPLSEEQRKEYVKIINEKAEESRISIRLNRGKIWAEIQEMEKKGEIPENDKFRAKDELQKLIDEYNEKIEELRKTKEQEIMTV